MYFLKCHGLFEISGAFSSRVKIGRLWNRSWQDQNLVGKQIAAPKFNITLKMAEVGRLGFLVGKAIIVFLEGKLVVKLPWVFVGSNSDGFLAPNLMSFWDPTFRTVENSFHTRGVMMKYQPKQGTIVDGSEMKSQTTTWDVKNLLSTGVTYLSTGAGFLPCRGNPFKLPYISIVWFPPRNGQFNDPCSGMACFFECG